MTNSIEVINLSKKYKDKEGNPMFKDREAIDRVFLRVYPEASKISFTFLKTLWH